MSTNNPILDHLDRQKSYKGKLNVPSWKLEQAETRTVTAARAMLFIAGFWLFTGLWAFATGEISGFGLAIELVFASIFAAGSYFGTSRPVPVFSLLLAVYWGLLLLIFAAAPNAFFNGIVWKIVFSALILAGLGNAFYSRHLRKKLELLELQHPEDVVYR